MNGIKTIIFDLGGVIVDLDVNKTIEAFARLSGKSVETIHQLYHEHRAFADFETGRIDHSTFRTEIRRLISLDESISDTTIDEAWNAMLLGIPKQKLDHLLKLKERYTVMILSNTNSIHIDHVHDVMLPAVANATSFQPFVHKVYYSYEIGLRKPDVSIYHHVLAEGQLLPAETLFLDDNPDNVRSAGQVGIRTHQVMHPDQVYEMTRA